MKNKIGRIWNLILIIIVFQLISCQKKIENKDITIIDNIVLGTPANTCGKYLDSLGIQSKVFFTRPIFYTFEKNILDNRIKFWYTTRFNYSDFGNANRSHLGLYYTISQSDAIVSYIVFIVNVLKPVFIFDDKKEEFIASLGSEYSYGGLSQSVCCLELDAILNALKAKYGEPQKYEKRSNNYYEIYGNEIKEYRTNPDSLFSFGQNELYVWNTKYVKISFFNGFTTPRMYFDIKTKFYSFEQAPNINEFTCNFGAYIQYELTNEAIKKLGLDKEKI